MLTHSQLVEIAAHWLQRKNCLPVLREQVCRVISGEVPDAIGWVAHYSILIECKTSRSDFLRDKQKIFRRPDCVDMGVGDFRFYFTNPGCVKEGSEVPDGWGVYECSPDGKPKHVFGVRYGNVCKVPFTGNKKNEIAMMRSFVRRNYAKI